MPPVPGDETRSDRDRADALDLILAPYPTVDAAQSDFHELVRLVEGGTVRSRA